MTSSGKLRWLKPVKPTTTVVQAENAGWLLNMRPDGCLIGCRLQPNSAGCEAEASRNSARQNFVSASVGARCGAIALEEGLA